MQSTNVIPIFDFRVYIHVEIPRIGVMIHTKSFIDGFKKMEFSRGKNQGVTGFENPKFPNRVFKLQKALYGLKLAPRAWYDRLKKFLLGKGFKMGLWTKLFSC